MPWNRLSFVCVAMPAAIGKYKDAASAFEMFPEKYATCDVLPTKEETGGAAYNAAYLAAGMMNLMERKVACVSISLEKENAF